MKRTLTLLNFFSLIILLFSCKAKQDIDYMQNSEQIATEVSIKNTKSTVQPGDNLMILVTAKDMDVVKVFNQNYSSEAYQYSINSGGPAQQNVQNVTGPTYNVDTEGNISYPLIGLINTTSKTTEQIREELTNKISKYVINPIVSVKTTNFKVTMLGEVTRPGTYLVPEGQVTILSALGLAGDLTIYGQRKNVLLVRNIDGNITKTRIDLTDSNFINSPNYYLKQNDLVYVESNNTKATSSRLGQNTTVIISVASVVLGLLGLIFRN